jgi:hypothetical protein
VQIDSPIFPGPIDCEESHFAAACFPIAFGFAVVVDPAGFAAPVASESVVVADPVAAVEAFADYLGTVPTQRLPTLHTDPFAGRKS